METLGGPSDTTADYARLAAMPILQGPAGIADVGAWLGTGRVDAAALVWRHPEEAELDPASHTSRFTATIPGPGADAMLVPTDTPAIDVPGTRVAPAVGPTVTGPQWDALTRSGMTPLPGESQEDYAARIAATIPWEAISPSPLSIPFHPDEAIIATFGVADSTSSMLPTDLPGAFAEFPPPVPHLLATTRTRGGGELDPHLLRAPATGVMRFERYHHLVGTVAGGIALRRPSQDGRIVLRGTPLAALDLFIVDAFDADAAIGGPLTVVLEDVRADSLLDTLPQLVMDQVRRFRTLRAATPFEFDGGGLRRELTATVAWTLRSWQAVAEIDDGIAQVPPSVRTALRALVPIGFVPFDQAGYDQLATAGELVSGDGEARFALQSFLQDVFASVLLGDTWPEVGINLDAAAPLPASGPERDLMEAARLFERWVPVFAGCPLGKAGRTWVPDDAAAAVWDAAAGRFPDPAAAHRGTLSTFAVEALYQAAAGAGGDSIADHAAARQNGLLTDLAVESHATGPLGCSQIGAKTVIRIVEPGLPKRPLTTLDWLREMARGTVRHHQQLPLLDFEAPGDAGHPLADLVQWRLFRVARQLRDQLDALRGHQVGGVGLEAATLAWWVANTALEDASGNWPSPFGAGITRTRPGGRTPYMAAGLAQAGRDRARTVGRRLLRRNGAPGLPAILWNVGEGGFDDFDLVAMQAAAAFVRDGRTLMGPVNPALVMALADTEGYRVFTGQNRIRSSSFQALFRGIPGVFMPGGADADEFAAAWSQTEWHLWAFGSCDVLNVPRRGTKPDPRRTDFLTMAEAQFRWVLDRLQRVDWTGLPGTAPPGPVDPARSLIDPAFFAAGDIRRLIQDRIAGRWSRPGGAGIDAVEFSRLSRRLEVIGLTIQSALFEWVHRQISTTRGYLFDMFPAAANPEQYDAVPELTGPPPPAPGPDAVHEERRAYLAYWAAVYMAHNTSVATWNLWMRRAAAAGPPNLSVSERLLFSLSNGANSSATVATLGNTMRFVVALDNYLRLDFAVDPDAADPLAGIDLTDPALRWLP